MVSTLFIPLMLANKDGNEGNFYARGILKSKLISFNCALFRPPKHSHDVARRSTTAAVGGFSVPRTTNNAEL